MNTNSAASYTMVKNIILAEDDIDDQNIFQIALEEVSPEIKLEFASNGKQMLEILTCLIKTGWNAWWISGIMISFHSYR